MLDEGISGFPWVVEAVLPVGPLKIPVDRTTGALGRGVTSWRGKVVKPNKSDVPTDVFLRAEYANVSAVIGCVRTHCEEGGVPLTIVHNPLATVALPCGVFGAAKEYVVSLSGEDMELVRL